MKTGIQIPYRVETILKRLDQAGYEAYIVGGCVRDSILGSTPYDWDLCTSAKPQEIMELFRGERMYTAGVQHGTVGLLYEKQCFEITTFRIDGDYTDNRHPDTVCFTNQIDTDLSRRDFTINAMAYHPVKGLVDPFGGLSDCEKRLIRCVGEPEKRFSEDALRMLRALRFSGKLKFEIEEKTKSAIHEMKALIHHIAMERIKGELDKILLEDEAERILMDYFDVWTEIIPELSNSYNSLSLLRYTPMEAALRWAVLLSRTAVGESFFKRLRFDKITQKQVEILLIYGNKKITAEKIFLKKLLRNYSEQTVFQILAFQKILKRKQPEASVLELAERMTQAILQNHECCRISMLAVNGNDLINLGVQPGNIIGEILEILLTKVIENQIENNKASLLKYVKFQILPKLKNKKDSGF